jgi:hypothetical protein
VRYLTSDELDEEKNDINSQKDAYPCRFREAHTGLGAVTLKTTKQYEYKLQMSI